MEIITECIENQYRIFHLQIIAKTLKHREELLLLAVNKA
jgi:hypothetical protein